jgi:hypothetical protein
MFLHILYRPQPSIDQGSLTSMEPAHLRLSYCGSLANQQMAGSAGNARLILDASGNSRDAG